MIILWADIKDLKPNPKEDLEWGKFAFGQEALDKWEKSLREEGYKKEKLMLVDWRGCIIDGNIRYHLAKKIGIKYLPIDFSFLVKNLNSFVKTQAYKWTELLKLNSKEMKKAEEKLEELRPNIVNCTEEEKLIYVKTIIEEILKKRN